MSSTGTSKSSAWLVVSAILLGSIVTIGGTLGIGLAAYRHLFPRGPRPTASARLDVQELPAPHTHGKFGAPPRALPLPTSEGFAAPEDSQATLPITEKIPIWGGDQALVTVVVFGDLNCPFTRHMFKMLGAIKADMPHDLRLAWRHRPTTVGSQNLARFAARLYDTHGAKYFWKFLDVVSRRSEKLSLRTLPELADEIGLPRTELSALANSKLVPAEVEKDLDQAVRYGVRRTPTLFINGLLVEGLIPHETLREIIEFERRAQVSALSLGVEPHALYSARVANTFVDLGTVPPERLCVPVGNAPTRGAREPQVTIVQFSDFQCSYCAQMRVTLGALLKSFGRKVRIAWKNFPLDNHAEARAAANLAMHATNEADPETFWKVHDALFENRASLGTTAYARILDRLGLDKAVYLAKVEAHEYDEEIDRDIELGQSLGVTGVPTSFINGRKVEGAHDLLTLAGLVAEELENMRRLKKAGYEPERLEQALCQPR